MGARTRPKHEPPDHFEGAKHCVVKPGELQVLGETLNAFLDGLGLSGLDEWREPFVASVSEAASVVLKHARPQFVHVTVWCRDRAVHVMLTEWGRLWLGKPEPAQVLGEIQLAMFDDAVYLPTPVANKWILSRDVGTATARLRRQSARQPASQPGVLQTRLVRLAQSALRVAGAPRATRLPYLGRTDELGEMARAVQTLQEVVAEREVLDAMIQRVPVGIAVVGPDGRYRSVNLAFATMHGHSGPEEMVGHHAAADLDPAVAASEGPRILELWEGKRDLVRIDNRYASPGRPVAWHSHTIAPLRGPDGLPEAVVAFVQDTTARTLQADRAARIQRELLPKRAPAMEGYEVWGACLPAQDVSGDFFDWVLRDDRWLDLTIADVMGKGMAAALVMAALRTGLRAAAGESGPAERLRTARASLTLGGDDDGLFVTLFQARVDLGTGTIRYVDAGHGYWAIRRAGGELVHVQGSTLPLLVQPDASLEEREVRLGPGDTLVLYSDGLVELEDKTMALADYREDLDEAEDTETLVARLMGRAPGHLADDVTVVALRRLAARSSQRATSPPGLSRTRVQ